MACRLSFYWLGSIVVVQGHIVCVEPWFEIRSYQPAGTEGSLCQALVPYKQHCVKQIHSPDKHKGWWLIQLKMFLPMVSAMTGTQDSAYTQESGICTQKWCSRYGNSLAKTSPDPRSTHCWLWFSLWKNDWLHLLLYHQVSIYAKGV